MPSKEPVPQPLQTNRPWITVAGCLGGGVITLIVILLVVVALVILFLFPELLDFGGQRRKGMTARMVTALGELSEKPALRVATREIAVQVEVTAPNQRKWRPWVLPIGPAFDVTIGQTTATVTSPSNIVQYIVPIARSNWRLDIDDRAATVTLPPPQVDEGVVEVQSDPAKLEIAVDRDWADHFIGDDAAKNAALAAIRKAVVEQASSPVAMFEVREKARRTVADIIAALIDPKHRPDRIIVRWTDDPAAD